MDKLRAQIDQTDEQIVELIRKRTRLTEEIGEQKKKDGLPIYRSDRHTSVYHKVARGVNDPLLKKAIQSIYREIMSLGMAVEGDLKIYSCGGNAAYHAARLAFGTSIEIEPCEMPMMFDRVAKNMNSFGFVPATGEGSDKTLLAILENSLSVYAEAYSDSAFGKPDRYFILSQCTVEPTGGDCTCVATVPLQGTTPDNLERCVSETGATLFSNRILETASAKYSILDFSGHKDEPDAAMILESIKARSSYIKILGSFPRAVSV